MGDDDAKKIILARRARFVAAALVGLNAATCGGKSSSNSDSDPKPCLSVVANPDGGTPQPCLTPPYMPPDAGHADADADTDADLDAEAGPLPCLSPPQDN